LSGKKAKHSQSSSSDRIFESLLCDEVKKPMIDVPEYSLAKSQIFEPSK
jgi:hypothetical protein